MSLADIVPVALTVRFKPARDPKEAKAAAAKRWAQKNRPHLNRYKREWRRRQRA